MGRRRRNSHALAAALLLASGCAQGGGGSDLGRSRSLGTDSGAADRADAGPGRPDASEDAAAARPPDVAGGAPRDYVVSLLQVAGELPSGSGLCPGFDLDDHDTASAADAVGCGRADFTAPDRFGGERGVDSQIGQLLVEAAAAVPGFDANAQLEGSVTRGSTLLLVRLLDVGDPVDDGHVEVLLYLGQMAASGTAPRTETTTWEAQTHLVLSSSQHFVIDTRSVEAGDPARPLIAFRDAWIEGGRLHTAPARFTADIGLTGGRTLPLALERARIAFDVVPGGLANGVIGGFLSVDDFSHAVVTLADNPAVTDGLVRTVVAPRADIDRDGVGGCESISLGLVLEAAPAVVDGVR